jgi:hypothetical protein
MCRAAAGAGRTPGMCAEFLGDDVVEKLYADVERHLNSDWYNPEAARANGLLISRR